MIARDANDSLDLLIDLGHLSSGVGHHVINAFSAIVSNAELLRLNPTLEGAVADPVALADTIINAALEASQVARRLIDYTRPLTAIESVSAAFDPLIVRLDHLAAEFVLAEQETSPPGVTWHTALDPIPPIRGHPGQLRTMLAHLLRNAREALPSSGGTIQVATFLDPRGWIVLEIRDEGHGMDAGTLEQAVEPFFSNKPGRLGIGLTIAHGIWRRHRGTLSIHSQPSRGTTLRLCVEPHADSALTPSRPGGIVP